MMTSTSVRVAAFLATVPLCACSANLSDRVHERFRQTVAAAGAPAVRVGNVIGEVEIDGWKEPRVAVDATKYAADTGKLKAMTIDVRSTDGTISIATRYSGAMREGGVRYRIHVPAAASLVVDNVTGTVDVARVDGDVRVKTRTGTVVADLGTVAGRRTIDLTATTGAIRLSLAAASSATVHAHSIVGDFSSDFSAITTTRQNLVGFDATGRIGSGTATILLSTTTGAIALRQRS